MKLIQWFGFIGQVSALFKENDMQWLTKLEDFGWQAGKIDKPGTSDSYYSVTIADGSSAHFASENIRVRIASG